MYDLCYLLVFDKAFRALFYFRIGRYKYLIWYWLKPDPSFIIATDMIVGSYVKLVHPFATVINANKIGDHFTVMQNVTIGNKGGNSSNIPTIGNNVCICCHAVVLGNISIGNNVIIGAGSVVTKSIPDDCVVVGNPARIIKQKGNTVNINL